MNPAAAPSQPNVFRLEDRWLLAAVRQVLLGQVLPDPPAVTGVDWNFLLRQASLHALVPCLAVYCEGRTDQIPAEVVAKLRQEQAGTRAYNFYLLQELKRLTRALEENRIEVLAWKGPALAAAVYPDLGIRQCADLDMMIRPAQMENAISLLRGFGYREQEVDTGGHSRNLERDGPKTVVELHELLVQPHFSLSLPAGELMEDAATVSTLAGAILVPGPEKLFFMLCVHGSKHSWERIIWICDIALFLKAHAKLDWARVWSLAGQCRALRMVHVALLLSAGLTMDVVPARELQRAKADKTAVRLADQAWEWLFLNRHTYSFYLRRMFYQVALREAQKDRWALVKHALVKGLAPGPADFAWVRLPHGLRWGYYPLRLFRLLLSFLSRR